MLLRNVPGGRYDRSLGEWRLVKVGKNGLLPPKGLESSQGRTGVSACSWSRWLQQARPLTRGNALGSYFAVGRAASQPDTGRDACATFAGYRLTKCHSVLRQVLRLRSVCPHGTRLQAFRNSLWLAALLFCSRVSGPTYPSIQAPTEERTPSRVRDSLRSR
jgi:hypothetical protein